MTTKSSDEPNDSRALAEFTELTRDGVERRTTEDLDEGLNLLFARIAACRTHRRGLVRWFVVGVTAAVCALVGLQVASDSRKGSRVAEPPALLYQIEGGSVLEGGYLRESGHAGIKLLFSEGSKFLLMPGARGRLRAVDPKGARVAIEHGAASFQVTPSNERRWVVEVGPFLVTVKGTVFTVSWDPSSERFELRLRHGRVVVSGPVSGGDIVLRAGQQLVVNLPRAETLIMDEKPEEAISESVGAPASLAVPPSALRPSVVRDKPVGPNRPQRPFHRPSPRSRASADGPTSWRADTGTGSSRTSNGPAPRRR